MHKEAHHRHAVPCVCSKNRKGNHCHECAELHASKKHTHTNDAVENVVKSHQASEVARANAE